MSKRHFQRETYNDDRMYVLRIARCTVKPAADDTAGTTVYYENVPDDALWCLVTYRNTARYPATRVDHFDSAAEARSYWSGSSRRCPVSAWKVGHRKRR